MLKKMKFMSIIRVLKSMKLVAIIAIILCLLFFKEMISLVQTPKDILTISQNELENKLVFLNLDAVYDSFMADKFKSGRSFNNYAVSFDDNHYIIAVQADYKIQEMLRPLQQETKEMLYSELQLKGVLKKMNDKESNAYYMYLAEKGLGTENYTTILPYILQISFRTYNDKIGLLLWGGSGIVLLSLIIIRMILAYTGRYQKNIIRQLQDMGPEKSAYIEKEYEEGKSFAGEIKLGNTYTFCHKGAKSVMFPIDDIQGIYVQKAKIQRRKDIIKNDLFIKVKGGDNYKISGMDSGHIMNYYRDKNPKLGSLITNVIDSDD